MICNPAMTKLGKGAVKLDNSRSSNTSFLKIRVASFDIKVCIDAVGLLDDSSIDLPLILFHELKMLLGQSFKKAFLKSVILFTFKLNVR